MGATDGERKRTAGTLGLRAGLAAACSLVGVQAAPAQSIAVDTALLFYKEPGRVSAVEALVEAARDYGYGRHGSLKVVFDALTGASANGATPAGQQQTFTSPSGSSGYTTPAAETPLDDTFQDMRVAASGRYQLPLDRLTTAGLGADVSVERDYTSFGASASLSRDFFKRNTTLTVDLSAAHDIVRPMGGRPVGFDPMPPPSASGHDDKAADEEGGDRPGTLGDGQKDVLDVSFGATQILDRRTLLQASWSYGQVRGYQSDPYKLLSVLDPATGGPTQYVYEKRPGAHHRQSVFARLKHHLDWSVLDLSYRYYRDDWGVRSHTAEMRLRWSLGHGSYLQPHLRYYWQTAADFYHRYLVAGGALPAAASADYRLGRFTARTVGLEYGRKLASGHRVTVRGEYYWQVGDSHPQDALAALSQFDLFPTVDAVVFQVGYSFGTR